MTASVPSGASRPELVVLPDERSLAAAAADRVLDLALDAARTKGRFCLAVSGGTTPALFLAELADRPMPWGQVHLFQVDERVAPDGDPERNLTQLEENLLERAPLPRSNVHPMPVTDSDLDGAATRYARELEGASGGVLDLAHLGLGDDGHTASWPPGDPVREVSDRDVTVVGPFRGTTRMTLTPAAVNRALRVLWLVSGEAKSSVLPRFLAGDASLPASVVSRVRSTVFADRAAAGSLE
jgi:6-phosphogluconolactonase